VTFSRLSARLLEKAVREGRLTEQRFRELVEQAGSMLLTLVFENEPILQHFRLALFRKNDGQLVHFVVVNKGDWSAHRVGDPLVFDKSILGKAMVDCTPIVYPRDKKKPFQKRNVKRFKSFVAVPVPCRTGTNAWGGLCIDHTGDDVVFTKDRVSAVADFGQFVDTLYSMIQKGA